MTGDPLPRSWPPLLRQLASSARPAPHQIDDDVYLVPRYLVRAISAIRNFCSSRGCW